MAFTPFARAYLGIYPEGSKRALLFRFAAFFHFAAEPCIPLHCGTPLPIALRNPRHLPHFGIHANFRTTG